MRQVPAGELERRDAGRNGVQDSQKPLRAGMGAVENGAVNHLACIPDHSFGV